MARERFNRMSVIGTCLLALLLPASIGAVTIHIDAVYYTSSYNAGGTGIRAENGTVNGLDYAGDWVGYDLPLDAFGFYHVTVRCWGELYTPYHLYLIIEDEEQNAQSVSIEFVGMGSCGS
jgi:hypothetical protein